MNKDEPTAAPAAKSNVAVTLGIEPETAKVVILRFTVPEGGDKPVMLGQGIDVTVPFYQVLLSKYPPGTAGEIEVGKLRFRISVEQLEQDHGDGLTFTPPTPLLHGGPKTPAES